MEHGSRLTRTGVLPGTPEYMAPEQFSEQQAGPAADVYSLATILYELLTGNTPFRSDNLAQILQRQAFERPQPPSQCRPDLPVYLDRVLLKALEKKPEHRYNCAGELLQAMAQPPVTGSHSARASNSGSLSDLPTRQVAYRQMTVDKKALPWSWVWAVWTVAALVWCWRLQPAPIPPQWLDRPLGWQPAPVGRQLCASVLWNGLEVALVGPQQSQAALPRAQFAAGQIDPQKSEEELTGAKDGDEFVIHNGGQEWLRIDAQMAANLKATPEQIGDYWLALLHDVHRLSRGQAPGQLKELERRRPLRLDETPPRYLLLERLYDRCRIRQREGALTAEVVMESMESLGGQDIKRLREAARSVPLPKP